jgi:hypothetical protein
LTEVLARKVRINWRRAKYFSSGGNTRPKSILKYSPRKTKSWDGMTSDFKMEINRSTRASILPGVWSTSLDLADAYFHCPISAAFRKYLRFEWDNKVFQFRALPFGLAITPLVFTKFGKLSQLICTRYLSRFIPTWTILLSRNSTQTFFCLIPRQL